MDDFVTYHDVAEFFAVAGLVTALMVLCFWIWFLLDD